jgi:hypothetical protein
MRRRHAEQGRGGEGRGDRGTSIYNLSICLWGFPCGSVGGSCRMPEYIEDTRDIRWRLKGGGGEGKRGLEGWRLPL